jgi:predicted DCC family thiol-disulfide oxidoreductase YuxK
MGDISDRSDSADRQLPACLRAGEPVVLFDGVCRLCSSWARFLIRFDKHHRFRLATVQSQAGQAILAWHGLATERYDTMVVSDGDTLNTKSNAFIHIIRRLPFPWPLASVVWLIPRPVRDWLYDRVAQNRYALFGRRETCFVPTADTMERFVDSPDT